MAYSPRGRSPAPLAPLSYEESRSPRNHEEHRSPRGRSPREYAEGYAPAPILDEHKSVSERGDRSPRAQAARVPPESPCERRSVFDDAVVMVGGGVRSLRPADDATSRSTRLDARALEQLRLQQMMHEGEPDAEKCSESDEDDSEEGDVYVTDSYIEWERHYLKRIAKRIHRLVCSELTREEEALFMYFVNFDADLDGTVSGEEATCMLEAIEEVAPGATKTRSGRRGLVNEDGSINFINLLKWFTENEKSKSTTMTFSVASMGVSIVGSGYLQSDDRVDALSRDSLRSNVIGYRRLFNAVKKYKEETQLAPARTVEGTSGLEQAMPEYYNALALEFQGDSEHLFELFNEVDESGNMMLEENEVEKLLLLLDTSATEEDLARYIAEINLSDGPLSFASLIDWWDQARSVPNSLVAEKGATLVASVKARAAQRKMTGMFSESCVQVQWRRAKEANRLQALRQAYVRAVSELREYKMERDLRLLESECAQL